MITSSPSGPDEDDQFAKNFSIALMPESTTSGGNGFAECSAWSFVSGIKSSITKVLELTFRKVF